MFQKKLASEIKKTVNEISEMKIVGQNNEVV